MNDFKGPLFVVGMPRSGTKLLRALLCNHPRIAIAKAETEILPYWAKHWTEYGDLRNFDTFQKFYRTALKSSFFHYMEKHRGKCVSAKEWHQACEGGALSDVFEALVRLDTGCTDDMIWGDKSPDYINHIPLLMQLYPDGKIIHIVRDVRDYCLSINKAWGKNMLRAAQRWADDVGSAQTALSSYPGRVIELRFEDLLDNSQGVLQTVSNFIGIEYEKQMLSLDKTTENIGDAKGSEEIVTGNKEKWRTRLDAASTRKIEKICREILNVYSYPTNYQGPVSRIHPIKMSLLKIQDGINLIFHDTEKGGIIKTILFHLRNMKHSGNS